jgi:hypothetical protein
VTRCWRCCHERKQAPSFSADSFPELIAFKDYAVWIELTELLAILAGAFMLLDYNWARWLALAWMAFHVAISFPVLHQMAVHSIIFAMIAWLLLRPDASSPVIST